MSWKTSLFLIALLGASAAVQAGRADPPDPPAVPTARAVPAQAPEGVADGVPPGESASAAAETRPMALALAGLGMALFLSHRRLGP